MSEKLTIREQIAKWLYNKAFHDSLDFTWEEAISLVPDDRVLTVLRIENVKKFREEADSILSLLDSPDSPYVLKSEVIKRIRGIESPYRKDPKYFPFSALKSEGFNEAIQKAVEEIQRK